jgi:hypothetical protein
LKTNSKAEREASHLRQTLSRLRDQLTPIVEVLLGREPLVRGSVYELRRKCGKPSCVCASGKKLHSCTAITWTAGDRKRLRSLSPKEEMELRRLTENYRRFRQARSQLVALYAKLLEVIDQLETVRCWDP